MQLQVETLELNRAANDIEELINDYMSQYRALYNQVSLASSYWQGKDQAAFVEKLDQFEEQFIKMTNLLNEYVMFLRNSAKAYTSTQDAILEAVQRLIG